MNSLINKFWGPIIGGRAAFGLLLLRLVVGGAFVQHGLGKIQNPFHWGDGMGIPTIFQGLAALAEFGGGLALIFGFLTPLAALGIVATMAVAYTKAGVGNPWIGQPGKPSFEVIAFYLISGLTLFLTGPGKLSIDSLFVGKKK